jgi:uncharacterized membrane protein
MSTSAKVSVASNVVALGALALAWAGFPSSMPLPYEWHKVLHIFGVVLFFGNAIVGPLWLAFAWTTPQTSHRVFAVQTLVAADIWLTMPGVQLTVWNGVCLARVYGGVQAQPWLIEALACVALTSLFAILVVLPAQERLAAACVAGDAEGARRALVRWSVGGTLVMLPPTLVAWLMVAKRPLLLG